MNPVNRIPIRPYLYNKLHVYGQQYFQPVQRPSYFLPMMQKRFPSLQQFFKHPEMKNPVIQKTSTRFDVAQRYAELDTDFSRVYPIIPELTNSERLTLAELAINKLSGKTDCCNFVRTTLIKFDLKQEGQSQIVTELDEKTNGFVSQSLKAQFGISEGKSTEKARDQKSKGIINK